MCTDMTWQRQPNAHASFGWARTPPNTRRSKALPGHEASGEATAPLWMAFVAKEFIIS